MIDASLKVPILLVDDRSENRLALQAVLKSDVHLLIEASSGQEALEYLKDNDCAVVLLDVQMPDMDGFETAFHIRCNERSRTTPIIFITASLEDDDRIYRGYEAGAVDYILKPFEPLILRSKVKVFVELYLAKKEIERQSELIRIQENQERDSFLEYALDAVVGVNTEGRVTYWNMQAENIFGWKKEEVMGKLMSELIVPSQFKVPHESGLLKYLSSGVGPILRKRIEVPALRKNGEEFPVELTVIPVRTKDGVTFSAFARDISERKKAEEEKRAEKEKLQKALYARDEFIGICSHELKTPLTSMKLQFQLASKQVERNDPRVNSPEAVMKRIQSSNIQIDRMSRLIDDMLDVSKISAGKLFMKNQDINFQDIVMEILERFNEQFVVLGIRLSFTPLKEKYIINGDPFRLEQVITNLLTNAIKYGNSKPISLELKPTNGMIRLDVKDQGMGIKNENLDLIFERYERAISSNNISGLGLGLYITKQIVEAHKGDISVASDFGRGSVFSVKFPVVQIQ